jgi:hypothetical protein
MPKVTLPPALEQKLDALHRSYEGVGHLESAPFAYLGEGAVFGMNGKIVLYVLFDEEPGEQEKSAFTKQAPAPIRNRGRWQGPLLCVRANEGDVLAEYGSGASDSVLARLVDKELSKPGYDKKVKGWARQALNVAGDAAPWRRYYDELHAWLVTSPPAATLLVLRPASREERNAGLGRAHASALGRIFDEVVPRAAVLCRDAGAVPIVRDFAQELVLYAARAVTRAEQRMALLPLLANANGTDEFADAAQDVLFGLDDGPLFDYVRALEPRDALVLFLRSDCVARFSCRPGAEVVLTDSFGRFFASSPDSTAIEAVRFRVEYALFTVWSAGSKAVFAAICRELAARRGVWEPLDAIRVLVATFEARGHGDAAALLRAAVAGG